MSTAYVLFNPLSGNHDFSDGCPDKLKAHIGERTTELCDIRELGDYSELFSTLDASDVIYVCGGDGTLNRFINDTEGKRGDNDIYYYPSGTGNDFYHEVGEKADGVPVRINEYIENLPIVTVNGKSYRFLNGVGYGIDGYCCEIGDKLRAESDKPVNYTSIAIKGLLFHYKPTNAVITVDGKEYSYQKVWLAPTMNGKYYGGGMIPTPGQDRINSDRTVSLLAFHGSGKLKTLMIFPSIFKGEHIKNEKFVAIHTGHTISVRYDRPAALQIDGETILNVSEYSVTSGATADAKTEAAQV